MNPFYLVAVAAHEGRLPPEAHPTYYASPEFYERIRFIGSTAEADQLNILLAMLKRVALDVREARRTRELLESGIACLQFFGVANPVSLLTLRVGSPELDMLKQAVEENLNGPLCRAVQRVRRQRLRAIERAYQEEILLDRLRQSLPWPTSADFKADADQAREAQSALAGVVSAKREALRERYRTRMAALARGTAPSVRSRTELVISLALEALPPTSVQ